MDFVKRLSLVGVAALLLAGCTDDLQPQPYNTGGYYPSNGYVVMTRPNYSSGYPSPVRYPQSAPQPAYSPRPVFAPEPPSPAVDTTWLSSIVPRAEAAPARPAPLPVAPPPDTNPDAGTYDCGWWRLCNLWN